MGGEWQEVEAGVERLDYFFATSTDAHVILYRFSPSGFRFRFEHALPPKTVASWAESLPRALLVMNGVYFHEDGFPSGWLERKGETIGTRHFDNDKSAVATLSSQVRIIDTKEETFDATSTLEAAQSYPFLVRDGQLAIDVDSGKFARRSFVGVDRDRRSYVGIVPDRNISLHQLAQILLATDVPWKRALNFDGGPSSGLISRTKEKADEINSFTGVPNVIVVERP